MIHTQEGAQLSSVKIYSAIQVQYLDLAVYISHSANVLVKGIHSPILSPALPQTGVFTRYGNRSRITLILNLLNSA